MKVLRSLDVLVLSSRDFQNLGPSKYLIDAGPWDVVLHLGRAQIWDPLRLYVEKERRASIKCGTLYFENNSTLKLLFYQLKVRCLPNIVGLLNFIWGIYLWNRFHLYSCIKKCHGNLKSGHLLPARVLWACNWLIFCLSLFDWKFYIILRASVLIFFLQILKIAARRLQTFWQRRGKTNRIKQAKDCI